MEYQILKWVTEELNLDQVDDLLTLLARIEARTKLEMIEQFLEILYKAKSELDIDGLIGVVGDWYTDIESHYRAELLYDDALFKQVRKRLNHAIEVTKLKREGKIVSPNEVKEAVTG